MSVNFYLCCPDEKTGVWIGQAESGFPNTMEILYSNEYDTMESLKAFLNDTKGKHLILLRDEDFYDMGYHNYEKDE